jgi:hypothetical protein
MAEPKHTPGPWYRNIPPATKYAVIFAGRNTHVTVLSVRGLPAEEVEANCDLIAAAPQLLAALKVAQDILIDFLTSDNADSVDSEKLEQIQAAITKAEGRTNG